ncbi:DUF6343 family protein [Streptomyces sp. NBC_00344]|uniref:DUF6343 family protein n=1 Tax=Streptomyces sp. NBC_00344 TaxID=2975720 RepID=UPI002E243FE4
MFGRKLERTGTEPLSAYSALGLRLVLSSAALPVFVAGAVLFGLWAAASSPHGSPSSALLAGLAIACGIIAALTAVDLAVIVRRRSQQRE